IVRFTKAHLAPIKAPHSAAPESTPYLVLGLRPESSDEEVKSAYRRLVRENHPDAMMARGVPEEVIHFANDKPAAINIAYETIEKARNRKLEFRSKTSDA